MTGESEKKLSLLLIEDTLDDELLAIRALRRCGLSLEIRVARDGGEALRALGLDGSEPEGDAPPPCLVISDLKMPRLNGDQVLLRARQDKRLQDVPFVIFSSSDEPADVERCLEFGASAYCRKPVAFDEYMECTAGIVRRWLGEALSEEPDCVLATSERE